MHDARFFKKRGGDTRQLTPSCGTRRIMLRIRSSALRTQPVVNTTHHTEDPARTQTPYFCRHKGGFRRVVLLIGRTSCKGTTVLWLPVESSGPFDPQLFSVQRSTCESRRVAGAFIACGDWLSIFMAALCSLASLTAVAARRRERCPMAAYMKYAISFALGTTFIRPKI